jgi:hypothetical protein
MRALIVIVIICVAVAALAQVCPESEPGYVRQNRPAGVEPNYPPISEPACLWYTTHGEQP